MLNNFILSAVIFVFSISIGLAQTSAVKAEEQYRNAQASSITAFEQSTKLTANDGLPFNTFGNSVAVSGNTAVIGASGTDIRENLG